MRWKIRTWACPARCCIRRSYIRIGAMVDIEECPLCAFEQDLFAAFHRAVQIHNRVCHERAQLFGSGQVSFVDLPKTDRPGAESLKDSIVLNHLGLQFFREHNRLYQVGHPQPRTRCFVPVSRADSALGRSNPASTQLAMLVEYPVVWQDKVSAIADQQVLIYFDS